MGGCSVHGCSNHSRNKIRMFRFPTDPERRKIWIINCRRTEQSIPKAAYLCVVHFDDHQFEQNREDGWKKLKPNAIPTLFPETEQKTRAPKCAPKSKKSSPKRVASSKKTAAKGSSKKEKASKKKKIVKGRSKSGVGGKTFVSVNNPQNSKTDGNQKKDLALYRISGGITPGSSENSQKENVLPRLRKSPMPFKIPALSTDSESSDKEDDAYDEVEEVVQEYKDTATEQQNVILKREIESLKQEVSEFEKHNKSMAQVIFELEKHNKLMGVKIIELEKENKVLTYKVGDLEKLNEDLKSKLDCSFTEEQLARMDKMRQLGTIERYIPALHQ